MAKRLTNEQRECLEEFFGLCHKLEKSLEQSLNELKYWADKSDEVFKDFDPKNLPKWVNKKMEEHQEKLHPLVKHLFLD